MKGVQALVEVLYVQTTRREEFIDITGLVREAVARSGVKEGLCHLFVPHTTCGLTINEHADPDVVADLQAALEKIAPRTGSYRHQEGNAAAHIKTSLLGVSHSLMVENGRLVLGTWQGIFLAEFDGPRRRQVWVQTMPSSPALPGNPGNAGLGNPQGLRRDQQGMKSVQATAPD